MGWVCGPAQGVLVWSLVVVRMAFSTATPHRYIQIHITYQVVLFKTFLFIYGIYQLLLPPYGWAQHFNHLSRRSN